MTKPNRMALARGLICISILWILGVSSTEVMEKKEPKILVIGAGVAGLGAATKLFENGFKDVTILEAENRIGGRIHTINFGKYKIDLGAEYIDGVLPKNPVYELVKPYNFVDRDDKRKVHFMYFDSMKGPLNKEITEKLDHFYEHVAKVDADKDYQSVGDFLENKFEEEFQGTTLHEEAPKYLRFFELMATTLKPARCWKDLPLNDKDRHKYEGDALVNWKEYGYSKFFDVLLKKYPKPEEELPVMKNIKFNSEVVNIDWSKGKDGPIAVTTLDGKAYEADHVIITVSLGVLKERYQKMFTPSLPDPTIKAIKDMGFGNSGKIILEFDKPFWKIEKDQTTSFNLLWTDHCRSIFEKAEYKSWLLGVTRFETIPYKTNLLWMYTTGEYANAMEALPEAKVLEHTTELLHYFFDKTYNVTSPIKMARSQWYSNPHFRGTYSYYTQEAMKEKVSGSTFKDFTKEADMKLFFAGEAMNPHRYATVDGALESGWEVADKLTTMYKMSN